MIKPMGLIPKGRKSKSVVVKQPSNSSSANPGPVSKPRKPRAKTIGYDSRSPKGVKKLNKSARQTMTRPGLVTSRASGG